MADAVIDLYDNDSIPKKQALYDDGKCRAPHVQGDQLWAGTSAIARGASYRFELRVTGKAPTSNLESFPNPTPVVAFELNDSGAYIGAIQSLPDGKVFFLFATTAAANTKTYAWDGTTLEVEDAPSTASTTPVLVALHEELFACYDSKIRRRKADGTWSDPTITPAPTSYKVAGAHTFKDSVWFLVDATYSGNSKAEVWKYTAVDGSVTLDQSYGTTGSTWNKTYTAGGSFDGYLYGSWNDGSGTNTLVRTAGTSWATAKAGLQIGEIVEYQGSIYGQYSATLKSPGTDPTGTWATIDSTFSEDLVVF